MVNRYYNEAWARRSGFTNVMELGSIKNMMLSNAVVLRIFTASGPIDNLRGKIYNKYAMGMWSVSKKGKPAELDSQISESKDGLIEMRMSGGDEKRYFFPMTAGRIFTESPSVLVDDKGIVKPAGGKRDSTVWFKTGAPYAFSISSPDIYDTIMPSKLKAKLKPLAVKWIDGAKDTRDKMNRLMHHLKNEYSYSLDFKRGASEDPVVDFLFNNRQGHCEYFASALALLARSIDIPSRVAAGYNVSGYNPLGDYYIVRQRNAHSWVEVWIENSGWVTYDPTPAAQIAWSPSGIVLVLDLLPAYFDKATEAAAGLSAMQLALIVFVFVFIWVVIRLIRFLKNRGGISPVQAGYKEPDAAFAELLQILEKSGLKREISEPLEQLTGQLEQLGEKGERAALLINEYTAWRYGMQGDIKKISEDITLWIKRWH
jgi:hypothetical protein